MKKIQMGVNYRANPYGLVRTICRAYDHEDGSASIVYAPINDGTGTVEDPLIMPEDQFYNTFVKNYSSVGVC